MILLFTFSTHASDVVELKLDEIVINGIQHSSDEDLQLHAGDEVQLILYSATGELTDTKPFSQLNRRDIHFVYLNEDGQREGMRDLIYSNNTTQCGNNPSGGEGWGCLWSFRVNNHKLKGGQYIFSPGNKWAYDNGYTDELKFDVESSNGAAIPGDSFITFMADEYVPSTGEDYVGNPQPGDVEVIGSGVVNIYGPDGEPVEVPYIIDQYDVMLTEGDIIITPEDIVPESEEGVATTQGAYINSDDSRWIDGVIPYYFESGASYTWKQNVRNAFAAWEAVTEVDFVEHSTAPSITHLKVNYTASKCSASIGGHASGYHKKYMNVPTSCSVGDMTHEAGHVIGFRHEHNRADRDDHVTHYPANIDSDENPNNWRRLSTFSTALSGAYDCDSIMHYSSCTGADDRISCQNTNGLDAAYAVLVPRNPANCSIGTTNHSAISNGDIAAVDAMYPPPPPPCSGCNC